MNLPHSTQRERISTRFSDFMTILQQDGTPLHRKIKQFRSSRPRPPWSTHFSQYPPFPAKGVFRNPATSNRRALIYLATACAFLSLIFTILVTIGTTYNRAVLTDVYFLRLDLSNVVPTTVPNSSLINSIARSLGLRDFYQAGLWGYCEGYNDVGVTYCSKPSLWYWFNPVDILMAQLLRGATIALPPDITRALDLARTVSYWMFVCFFTGTTFTTLSILTGWTTIYSRWLSGIIGTISLISAIFTTLAATIATTLYSLFRSTFEKAPQVTVRGILGQQMFSYMWLAAGFAMLSFVLHTTLCFVGRSERGEIKRRMRVERHWDKVREMEERRGEEGNEIVKAEERSTLGSSGNGSGTRNGNGNGNLTNSGNENDASSLPLLVPQLGPPHTATAAVASHTQDFPTPPPPTAYYHVNLGHYS